MTRAAPARPFQIPQSLTVTTVDMFSLRGGQTTPAGTATDAPETALNLELFGLRSAGPSGRSSAIIRRPDGTQGVFFVGDEIIEGVQLDRVLPDRVMIRRMGVLEAVLLDKVRGSTLAASTSTKGAPVEAPSSASLEPLRRRIDVGADALFQAIDVRPAVSRAGAPALRLNPRGDGELFRSAGLEAGDVLLSINGQQLGDLARAQSAIAAIASSLSFVVEVERGDNVLALRMIVDR